MFRRIDPSKAPICKIKTHSIKNKIKEIKENSIKHNQEAKHKEPDDNKCRRYEFYYDVVLRGQYTFHIRDLHKQYGPIIRINPYELHISDPDYYDTLYASSASGEKRDKWGWYTKQFGTPEAMFGTTAHDQHKVRRAALNRFFSMASVRRLQPLLEERVQRLLGRFRKARDSKEVIPLEYALAAFTNGKVPGKPTV
jgi:cytochrome P450